MLKRLPLLAILAVPVLFAGDAFAVNKRVREACKNDYRAYCSAFDVGSEQLRSCMRSVKTKLSKRCRTALVEEGEATPRDIKDYRDKKR